MDELLDKELEKQGLESEWLIIFSDGLRRLPSLETLDLQICLACRRDDLRREILAEADLRPEEWFGYLTDEGTYEVRGDLEDLTDLDVRDSFGQFLSDYVETLSFTDLSLNAQDALRQHFGDVSEDIQTVRRAALRSCDRFKECGEYYRLPSLSYEDFSCLWKAREEVSDSDLVTAEDADALAVCLAAGDFGAALDIVGEENRVDLERLFEEW